MLRHFNLSKNWLRISLIKVGSKGQLQSESRPSNEGLQFLNVVNFFLNVILTDLLTKQLQTDNFPKPEAAAEVHVARNVGNTRAYAALRLLQFRIQINIHLFEESIGSVFVTLKHVAHLRKSHRFSD
jgi:hypothetical protein